MDYIQKIRYAANSCYNCALSKAAERDLTGAAELLKRALHFNKYHTDARNLLGLIFYEMGETSDALVQWVISINLQPEDNRADHYLDEVQRKPGQLEIASQTIKKYNQALIHAQNGSADLAILQLKRIVDEKPNFVKAHLLLALLFMDREEYTKAGKSLYRVLQIDKNNPQAQRYMDFVKQNTGKADIEKRKLKNAFSHREMQDDDVILPPTYKENTGWQSIINIGIGLVLGILVVLFLVMPARVRSLNYDHNEEMCAYTDKLYLANREISDLKARCEEAENTIENSRKELEDLAGDSSSAITQYSMIAQIQRALANDEISSAVRIYIDLDESLITDEAMIGILNEIRAQMNELAPPKLKEMAEQAAAAGDPDTALHYYEAYRTINDKDPQIIFDMAMIYKQKGDTETANNLFGQVIMNFNDEELKARAKEERGY